MPVEDTFYIRNMYVLLLDSFVKPPCNSHWKSIYTSWVSTWIRRMNKFSRHGFVYMMNDIVLIFFSWNIQGVSPYIASNIQHCIRTWWSISLFPAVIRPPIQGWGFSLKHISWSKCDLWPFIVCSMKEDPTLHWQDIEWNIPSMKSPPEINHSIQPQTYGKLTDSSLFATFNGYNLFTSLDGCDVKWIIFPILCLVRFLFSLAIPSLAGHFCRGYQCR